MFPFLPEGGKSFVLNAVLHDVHDRALQHRDVLQRIAVDDEDVRELADRDGAQHAIDALHLRRPQRRGLDRFQRCEPGLDEVGDLLRERAVEIERRARIAAGLRSRIPGGPPAGRLARSATDSS